MVFGQENIMEDLMIDSTWIKNVTEFVYLGSLLTWDIINSNINMLHRTKMRWQIN